MQSHRPVFRVLGRTLLVLPLPTSTTMSDLLFSGFGNTHIYDLISESNPVLFRLHICEAPGTGGPSLNEHMITAPQYANLSPSDLYMLPLLYQGTYAEVSRHVNVYKNMKKRDSLDFRSPWVSVTWNFPYLIWEASRRLMYRFATGKFWPIVLFHIVKLSSCSRT